MFGRRHEFDRRETARVAADIGVSPAELRVQADTATSRPGRLRRMLNVLRPKRADLLDDRRVTRDLERVCAACDATRKCERWLRRTEKPGQASELYPPTFCPNRDTLNAVKDR